MNSPEQEPGDNFAYKGECILIVFDPLVKTSKCKITKSIKKRKGKRTKPATILTIQANEQTSDEQENQSMQKKKS